MINIIKDILVADDIDSPLYCEFITVFEYKGKKFWADRNFAVCSGAWDRSDITYLTGELERTYGCCPVVVDGGREDFIDEQELIFAAEFLMKSKKDEVCFHDVDDEKINHTFDNFVKTHPELQR